MTGAIAGGSELGLGLGLLVRHLPQPVERAARRWVYPVVLAARNRRLPLALAKGEIRGQAAAILVCGQEPWALDLPRRAFGESLRLERLGSVPLWQLSSAVAKHFPEVDMVMARLDRLSARLLFRAGDLRVPEWVDTVLTIPDDLDKMLRAHRSLKEDARLVRKYGFTAAISTSPADFDEFYESMYLPFVASRHAEMAWPTNPHSLRRIFAQGGIIWLTYEGERISGLLFGITGDTLHMWAEGTRGGDFAVVKRGAVCALFLHAIRHAKERHCRYVHFGGSKACLSDGLLRYKLKWGVEIQARPENQFHTLVRWPKWNDAVAGFLSDVQVLHQEGPKLTPVGHALACP